MTTLNTPAKDDENEPCEQYTCYTCDKTQFINTSQTISCEKCGGRIFRKERTNHIVQYIAR